MTAQEGWFFKNKLKTAFYFLITSIYIGTLHQLIFFAVHLFMH